MGAPILMVVDEDLGGAGGAQRRPRPPLRVDYRSHRAARPVVITCWAAAVTLMLGGSWRGGRERRVGHGDPALHRHGCLVVAFSGAIDLASVATVQRTLLKDLSEQPDALICDLAGVQRLDPTAAAVFSTVAKHPASRWPTTSFLLCGARPQVAEALRRVRASQLVRMYVTAAAGPSGPGGRGRPGALAGGAAGTGLGVRPAPDGGKTVWCALTL